MYPVRKTIPRDIMGEAPRARITAQNTLTTWHTDRLYGAMVIEWLLTSLSVYWQGYCGDRLLLALLLNGDQNRHAACWLAVGGSIIL